MYDFPVSSSHHQQQQEQTNYLPRRQAYGMLTSAPYAQQQQQQVPRSYPGLNAPAQSTYGKPTAIAPAAAGWQQKQQEGYQHVTAVQAVQEQEVAQSTDVDALMRAIQAKPSQSPGDNNSNSDVVRAERARDMSAESEKSLSRGVSGGAGANASGGGEDPKKRYECHIGECRKAFFQKTHLEIHIRAHTGAKPYVCLSLPPNQPPPKPPEI